ncbi:MAG TPA: heparinase II/III family protein [Planctomycetota bacterium]|nr:heparinase II/III family protein [Planctomycetota bacterium]
MRFNATHYIKRALSMPPHQALRKAWQLGRNKYQAWHTRAKDANRPTYATDFSQARLLQYVTRLPLSVLRENREMITGLAQNYLDHRFDLLGSGWVQVKHGMRCRGFDGHRYDSGAVVTADREGRWLEGRINPSNLREAKKLWTLIDADYVPIDWQLDFKTGLRWSESTWFHDIAYPKVPGGDVKVPWEISRAQHLPVLAYAYALSATGEPGFEPKECYAREFRNQILDFIATNPPRYGVNWCCAMDVGIRIANWLMSADLFRAAGATFDADFERVLTRSVFEHADYIMHNLEWQPQLRSNHYLADIAGLLFAAAYLPRSPLSDAWLAFAVKEVIAETLDQFLADGSNFEASTSYHRLSAEMAVYACALILALSESKRAALASYDHRLVTVPAGLPPAPAKEFSVAGRMSLLPQEIFQRLARMADFSRDVTAPDGKIIQIGDSDSGRFFKLHPLVTKLTVREAKARYATLDGYEALPDSAIYWDEDFLDHSPLVAAIDGFFSSESDSRWLDFHLIRQFVTPVADRHPASLQPASHEDALDKTLKEIAAQPENCRQQIEIEAPGASLLGNLKTVAYPDFGLYIFSSSRLYLAVRCGSIGQRGNGGHAHNDQLAMTLYVDGKAWITDPGTYCYLPFVEKRNAYRSITAHWTPQLRSGKEPSSFSAGAFQIVGDPKATCVYFGKRGFAGYHTAFGAKTWRVITLQENLIFVNDAAPAEIAQLPVPAADKPVAPRVPFSPGYGQALR